MTTLKELYEAAKEKGLENAPVFFDIIGEDVYMLNRTPHIRFGTRQPAVYLVGRAEVDREGIEFERCW